MWSKLDQKDKCSCQNIKCHKMSDLENKMDIFDTLEFDYIQCWPKETLQALFYKAKVPSSGGYSKI